MPQSTEARYGLDYNFKAGDNGWGASFNKHVSVTGAMMNAFLMSTIINVPPSSPADGDAYYVAPNSTGAWQGQDGKIAAWQAAAWTFLVSPKGLRAYVVDQAAFYWFNGTAWAVETAAPGSGAGAGPVSGANPGTGSFPPPSGGIYDGLGHRYWRLNIYQNGQGRLPAIASLSLARTAGGDNAATDSSKALAAPVPPAPNGLPNGGVGLEAAKAFDGDPGTYWMAPYWYPNTTMPQYIGYDFGDETPFIQEVIITPRNDNDAGANYAPQDFTVDWSDDGVIWTRQQSYSAVLPWKKGTAQTFSVPYQSPFVRPAYEVRGLDPASRADGDKGANLMLSGGNARTDVTPSTSGAAGVQLGGDIIITGGTSNDLTKFGNVILKNLPPADPHVLGALWVGTNGVLMVSAG